MLGGRAALREVAFLCRQDRLEGMVVEDGFLPILTE